jgi:hypothetical protein
VNLTSRSRGQSALRLRSPHPGPGTARSKCMSAVFKTAAFDRSATPGGKKYGEAAGSGRPPGCGLGSPRLMNPSQSAFGRDLASNSEDEFKQTVALDQCLGLRNRRYSFYLARRRSDARWRPSGPRARIRSHGRFRHVCARQGSGDPVDVATSGIAQSPARDADRVAWSLAPAPRAPRSGTRPREWARLAFEQSRRPSRGLW